MDRTFLVLGLVVAGTTSASADSPAGADAAPTPVAPSTNPDYDQFNVPKGGVVIDAFATMDLSKNVAGKAISVTPDLWFGVTDDITIGIVHSSVGETGFLGGIGDSLCLSGTSGECPHVYNNVGADLRYRLLAPLSLDTGVYVDSFSPSFDLGLKVGLDGRWRIGRLGIEIQPNVFIELTNRDSSLPPGNQETFNLPITASLAVVPSFDLFVQTGAVLPIGITGDDFCAIPLSVGARYAVTPRLSVGAAFTLTQLVGSSSLDTGTDFRVLQVGGSYAL